MSISLAGITQAQADCIHHWDIVGTHDINPATGRRYGKNTPGTCRHCGLERMFDSSPAQHTKDTFTLETQPPD